MRMVRLLAASSEVRIQSVLPCIFLTSFLISLVATVCMKYGLRLLNSMCVTKKEPLGPKGQTLSQPRFETEVIKHVAD
jgi:hypothetical protein